ncbi:nuclease-related domain-containing protein [Virgibacillus litoralis]|uniref:Zn ribbon nucleic-acid-binding protein n=1 Tax=Virgibacillus litoralis TaxID=578221 RepID=A0ABS4HFT7_9BACI|nr:nuclease-related domain-containing protein [Virgibacillus litoralis]MBP1949728.1 Zn ribbon nucleic-acid-binding protein [Virgibacillus litoralis]
MFVKPFEVPKHILQAEALDTRTPVNHIQKETINKKARNLRTGYNGEKSMEFFLSFLPEHEFIIFHYLRIPDKQGHFQIDILLLSLKFFLIIEVKNIYDNMHFDGMGQAYRNNNDEIEVFTNPVDQVNLQHRRFLDYLRKYDLPSIPIEKIVVYSRDDTFLKNITNNKTINEIVMHKEKVLPRIEEFSEMYQTTSFSEDQLMGITFKLLEEHEPEEYNGMKKFDVTPKEFVKGVFCPECGKVPMLWRGGKWRCTDCGCTSRNAHRSVLADFALLVGDYINNRQAREFLQVWSEYSVKRLLQQEHFDQIGEKSGRKYRLDVEKLLNPEVHKKSTDVHN